MIISKNLIMPTIRRTMAVVSIHPVAFRRR
jgi:hypothetical protein